MPELPEIQTIVSDLKKYATGANVKSVIVHENYIVYPGEEYFINNLEDSTVVNVKRIAKNIVLTTTTQHNVTMHLAMTGRLLLRQPDHPDEPHERVRLVMEKNNKEFHLRFADMRKFGKVQLIHENLMNKFKQKYGPEPLDKNLTPQSFLNLLQSKNTIVKNVLLEQHIISGLGNVYANDALWISQIHPETPTKNLNTEHAERLLNASREILNEGIKNRGISMSDYVDLFEKKGFQQNFFRVYQQQICKRCNSEIEFKKISGRGTYFCPKCQSKATPLFN